MRQTSGQRDRQAQRLRLLEQVRVLPARHFVLVEVGAGGEHGTFERRVELARLAPVLGDGVERRAVEAAVSRGVNRRPSTSVFRFGCDVPPDIDAIARVGNVEPCLGGVEDRRRLHAARVVRVEVNRNADFLACSALTSIRRRVRLAQARPCP